MNTGPSEANCDGQSREEVVYSDPRSMTCEAPLAMRKRPWDTIHTRSMFDRAYDADAIRVEYHLLRASQPG